MIKELQVDIPIILYSGKSIMIDGIQSAQTVIAAIVNKPFRINKLDGIIKKVIKENVSNRHEQ